VQHVGGAVRAERAERLAGRVLPLEALRGEILRRVAVGRDPALVEAGATS